MNEVIVHAHNTLQQTIQFYGKALEVAVQEKIAAEQKHHRLEEALQACNTRLVELQTDRDRLASDLVLLQGAGAPSIPDTSTPPSRAKRTAKRTGPAARARKRLEAAHNDHAP